MSGINLIPDPNQRALLENAVDSTFQTLKRAFVVYVQAQVATISTNATYSQFGPHDQNQFNPAVNPQAQTIYGTIMYGNQQPWQFIEPSNRTNYDQNKLKNDFGTIRIKVDVAGYQLMIGCKTVVLDGFNFKLTSSARPHGLFSPQRYTFFLEVVD